MLILGLTGGIDSLFESTGISDTGQGHDTAAVLMEDGVVIAGIEEERIIRIKHTDKIWASAVRFCLENTNKSMDDVDFVAFYTSEDLLNILLKKYQLKMPELINFPDIRYLYQHLFKRELGYEVNRDIFRFVNHHVAHASTAYYMSGFDKSLVISLDGTGDGLSTMVADFEKTNLNILATKFIADSLGFFYLKVIAFLGYREFDEYKVMGLAPYGDPSVYRKKFNRFYELLPNGDYTIHQDRILEMYELLQPRMRNEPFTQVHMDIAAALQEALEIIVFHILRHFQKVTGHTRLVISGGVGQNSSMNGKILCSGLFEDVFLPSFAGDSGCAYGAAAYVAHQMKPELSFTRIPHAYWGTPIHDDEVGGALDAWNAFLQVEKMEDRSEQVANLIVDGAVIGWVQGRSEFGPRALGNRSILADPRVASHKETINAMIKMREGYRPFAPSILEERVLDFFEVPGEHADFPFMSFVLNVKPEWRARLPAITHVDGSARLQTVSRDTNPRYWELIDAFSRKTGIPILLNTSFNNNAEPIVDNINDAVVCYLTSGLDYLVMGDYLARKKAWQPENLVGLIVSLPKAAILLREDRYTSHSERGFSYEIVWNYDSARRYTLSEAWYKLLQTADGKQSVGQLMLNLGFSTDQQAQALEELPGLWSDRLLVLRPNSKRRGLLL